MNNESLKVLKLDPRAVVRGANAREECSEAGMAELIESVRSLGVVVPVIVREVDGGSWELVAGGRRLTAALEVGLEWIPAMVVADCNDGDASILGLVENGPREALPADMLARGVAEACSFATVAEVARGLGWSEDNVERCLQVVRLPRELARWLVRETGAEIKVLAKLAGAGDAVVGLAVAWMEGGFGVPRSVERWVDGLAQQAANEEWLVSEGGRPATEEERERFFVDGRLQAGAGVEDLDGVVDRAVLRSVEGVPEVVTWRDVVEGADFEVVRAVVDGRRYELLSYASIFAFDKSPGGRGWLRRSPLSGEQAEAREVAAARQRVRGENAGLLRGLVAARGADGAARAVARAGKVFLGAEVAEFVEETVPGGDGAAECAVILALVMAQGGAVGSQEWWSEVEGGEEEEG